MPVLRHGVELHFSHNLMVNCKSVPVLHYRVERKYRSPILYTFPQRTLNECLAPSHSFFRTFPKFRSRQSPVFNTSATQLIQTDTCFRTLNPKSTLGVEWHYLFLSHRRSWRWRLREQWEQQPYSHTIALKAAEPFWPCCSQKCMTQLIHLENLLQKIQLLRSSWVRMRGWVLTAALIVWR